MNGPEGAKRRGGIGWSGQPSARDVAALAKVSPQTVSRVANGAPNVQPATRERVLAAMAKIGYTPNAAARALRSGRHGAVGVVLHHLTRTGEAHIVQAVADSAQAHGYDVTLIDAAGAAPTDLNRAIAKVRLGVDGVVVLGLETQDVEAVEFPPRVPVVVADSRLHRHPAVGIDQRGGAHLAVTHLLGLGHRTVHHVAGPADSLQAREREQAWRDALLAAGRAVPEPWRGDWTPASGYLAGQAIAAEPDVTALFVANDEMAAGVLRALHEVGRAVPASISVVGFDDVMAEYLWPPLTTIQQDFAAVGEHLLELLLRQIDPVRRAGPDVATLIPARLVVRASTAAPTPA